MEEFLKITELNDFIFCPLSIYFHKLYYENDQSIYNTTIQTKGTNAHKTIEDRKYSTTNNVLQAIEVYCEKYNIVGKIDLFYIDEKKLVERKKKITRIYDGYIFQLYAQMDCLIEMGYDVEHLELRSYDDNKVYPINLPNDDMEMKSKYIKLMKEINLFSIDDYKQNNYDKCKMCIYHNICDRSLYDE